jgi:hypothetical protein
MTDNPTPFSRLLSWLRKVFSHLFYGNRFEFDKELEPSPALTLRKKAKPPKNSLRQWLMDNDYADVVDIIEQVTAKWREQGKATRRNWWDVLAGDSHGLPRVIEGIEIPVLKIAQVRQGRQITMNALCRSENEQLPDKPRKIRGD